ncbi:molybdate transport system regulatory protein [Paucimonas lemoignei]|uniref:Molybdate transport system regulatory protein n=1 Tax=Paucimonas lemoignei TaxID=29443 RepID=A0A4R3I0U2_PAULE|nr:TOBE domain-containing protein [Paucimonas lemoignei]TCS39158.1 molybdate transport system regulatory protein [Paucimonas lemoignei]
MENEKGIQLQGSVWLTVAGEKFGGHARIALLSQIAACGSITQAAKAAGMSYKAAWDAIDEMNNLAGEPLVERAAGGKGGGGTRLTQRGAQLVENFATIEREHRHFIEQLGRQARGIADDYLMFRRMGMKTSARNQYWGKVVEVRTGAVNDQVVLELPSGHPIVAVITHESTLDLGLAPGAEAFALIKSSMIILAKDDERARFSARNRLRGTVTRIQDGAVNADVIVELSDGVTLAAIVTNESCRELALAVGEQVTAIFKESSVILGTPA